MAGTLASQPPKVLATKLTPEIPNPSTSSTMMLSSQLPLTTVVNITNSLFHLRVTPRLVPRWNSSQSKRIATLQTVRLPNLEFNTAMNSTTEEKIPSISHIEK